MYSLIYYNMFQYQIRSFWKGTDTQKMNCTYDLHYSKCMFEYIKAPYNERVTYHIVYNPE